MMPASPSWYSRSTVITSSGSAVSAKAVKPRRSQNTMVTSLAVAVEQLLAAGRQHQLGDLRREEALQPRHALDLAELIGDALLQVAGSCR